MRRGTGARDWGNVPEEYVPIEQPDENASELSPRTRLIRLVQEYGHRIANEQNLDTH